jgi:hypothetical protein
MSKFDPITLYFIIFESMGIWLWLLGCFAFVLLVGVFASALRLRRGGRSSGRSILTGAATGIATTIIAFFLIPSWTLAGIDALNGPIDYAVAFLLALVPGIFAGALGFTLAAWTVRGERPAS